MSPRIRRHILFLSIILWAGSLFGQMRMIPHLTRTSGGFTTSVIIENESIETVTYRLTPYDKDGNLLQGDEGQEIRVEGIIAGQAVVSMPAGELFPGTVDASHFSIEGDGIMVSVAYNSTNGGSPAHVGETSVEATSYRLFTGDWSQVFDGFAVVNMGEQTADVWVSERDSSGDIIQSVRAIDDLAPMAKGLWIIGQPSGSPFNGGGANYEVYSTQPLAITALRGDLPGSNFLWVNQATPKSEAATSRDELGIWFIDGGTLYDVAEAMGYAVAMDRVFQLETHRASARGTAAEILGQDALALDIFARTQGYSDEELRQGFENLSPDGKTMVQGYVDGINRHLAEITADPELAPAELVLQGITPKPWTTEDVLAFISLLLRQFDPNGWAQGQLDNAAVLQQLQAGYPDSAALMFEDLIWLNDPDAQTMIPDLGPTKTRPKATAPPIGPLRDDIDFTALAASFREGKAHRDRILKELGAKFKMGSYAWVVAGEHTASGNPIIYSGPQMGFSAPAITVEGSIRGGGLEISGMTVPGIPGIIIGRTPHHAWSMQVGHAHGADLYFEPLAELTEPHRIETFNVAGGNPVQVPIFRTEHGPVIGQDEGQGIAIAWNYAHWGKEFDTIQAVLDLARAQSMDEFGAGIEGIAVSQHYCYADRDGNIAYWMSGHDPLRPPGEYRLPQGTLQGVPISEYDADVLRERAHDRNTAQGFYGGWNNKAEKDYDGQPYGSSGSLGPAHRAHVVDQGLRDLVGRGNVTYEEIRDLALDVATTDSFGNGGNPWQFVAEEFTQAVEADTNETRSAALDILNAWDGHFVAGGEENWVSGMDRSDGWVLMDNWIRKVLGSVFDEVDGVRTRQFFNVLLHEIESNSTIQTNYAWLTSQDASAPQTLGEHVVQALDAALAELGEQPWGIGQRGTLHYGHPLLDALPPGTIDLPFPATPFSSRSTYAHCVEYGSDGPVRIESMFPLGESGFATVDLSAFPPAINFHENALSMVPFFDNFTLRVFPLFP